MCKLNSIAFFCVMLFFLGGVFREASCFESEQSSVAASPVELEPSTPVAELEGSTPLVVLQEITPLTESAVTPFVKLENSEVFSSLLNVSDPLQVLNVIALNTEYATRDGAQVPLKSETLETAMVFFGCKTGFTLVGGPSRRTFNISALKKTADCITDLPTCVPNVCWWTEETDVEFLYNKEGLWDEANHYPEGTAAIYPRRACPPGYLFSADKNKRLCQSNGTWSDLEPSCERYQNVNQLRITFWILIVCFVTVVASTLIVRQVFKKRQKRKEPVNSEMVAETHQVPRIKSASVPACLPPVIRNTYVSQEMLISSRCNVNLVEPGEGSSETSVKIACEQTLSVFNEKAEVEIKKARSEELVTESFL